MQALAVLSPAVEAFRLNLAALVAPQFPVSVLGSVLHQCVSALGAPHNLSLTQSRLTAESVHITGASHDALQVSGGVADPAASGR